MSSDPDLGLIGTYVRLKKRGGTYRVVRWESFEHRYVLQLMTPGTRPVHARPDELVQVEDGSMATSDGSSL